MLCYNIYFYFQTRFELVISNNERSLSAPIATELEKTTILKVGE